MRAYAIKVRASEPEPLIQLEDGRILLSDSERPLELGALETSLNDPCAQVVIDLRQMRATMSRDRLGQRPLVWARVSGALLVASKESILLGHPKIGAELDEEYLCAHLAGVNAVPGHTLYRQIAAVDPGSVAVVDGSRVQVRSVAFDPDPIAYAMRDEPAGNRFRDLLEGSVARSCDGVSELGVCLSAGLDSSSIAVLLPKSRQTSSTVALNYGTTYRGSVDERGLARELCSRIGLRYEGLDTADYPPTLDLLGMDADPGHPYVNPYLALNAAVYRRFRDLGVDVFLTGHFADFWNPGPEAWLRDALRNRRWQLITDMIAGHWRQGGIGALWHDQGWRYLAKLMLRRNTGRRGFEWLAPSWREWVWDRIANDLRRFADWPHPDRAAYNFGSAAALDGAYEGHFRDQFGIHSRHPYRNWPLLQFALSLPAYQNRRGLSDKWVARRAVAGILPERWSERPKQGGLLPFLQATEEVHGRAGLRQLIDDGQALWKTYLDKKYVDSLLATREAVEDWLFWQLVMMGVWQRHAQP
ncbi:MAG: asparagine synthase [Xanthomonadales bacterium]|nr:asparagine synthase [Xanthomonadales bacterium]MCP5476875.1 asparagine synthase [Rhodanobacteraceae bacterium]